MESPTTGVDIARIHTHVYDDDGDGPGRGWVKELQVGASGDPDQDHLAAYSHDEHTGRLDTVAHKGTESFAYDYLAKSHLFEKITGPNLGADAFTVTNTHEAYRDLRVRVRSEKATTGLVDYQYKYNEIGQRYNYIEDGSLVGNNGSSDGSWIIGYNDKGEVVRADRSHKEFFDQTTGITDELDYAYDPIGNRVSADWTRFSFDDHHWTYWNDPSGTDPEDEAGDEVNQYRRIDYQINAGTPVQAARVHDADGNLLEDGAKRYVWDAENRLIEVYDNNGTNGNHTDDVLLAEYRYDYMGRRVWKKTTSATAIPAEGRDVERIFVYCGWNLCAEYNATTTAGVSSIDSVKRTYTWGLDLSGSLQGAGGVGGLLAMEDHGESMVLYPLYDANGNVAAMIDESGAREAWYLRRPFGAHWWGLGDYLNENPIRFSTKYFDLETGLYYYGYRYYDPETGRWVSREPLADESFFRNYSSNSSRSSTNSAVETGAFRDETFRNLYLFSRNRPVDFIDHLGLKALYGNFCGPGGGGIPIDDLDQLCKEHDDCYAACGAAGPAGVLMGGPCVEKCDWTLCKDAIKLPGGGGLKKNIARAAIIGIFCNCVAHKRPKDPWKPPLVPPIWWP